jgi:hypothetical protein
LASYAPDLEPGLGDGGAGTLEIVLQSGLTIARGRRVFAWQRHFCIQSKAIPSYFSFFEKRCSSASQLSFIKNGNQQTVKQFFQSEFIFGGACHVE